MKGLKLENVILRAPCVVFIQQCIEHCLRHLVAVEFGTGADGKPFTQLCGGLVFTGYSDGTFAAYDDTTLELKWKINMGAGFTSPPMTFYAGSNQYVAIATGLSRIAKIMLGKSPEVAEMRNSTVLYVFAVE